MWDFNLTPEQITEVTYMCLGLSLAAVSGLRATMPLFLVSVFVQMHPDGVLKIVPSMEFVVKPWFTMVMGALLVLETFADKIPQVDHALHVVLLIVSPIAGAAAVRAFVSPTSTSKLWVESMMVLGALLALNTHMGRAYLRVLSTQHTAGGMNPCVSLVEDALIVAMVLASLVFSLAAVLIALIVIVLLLVAVALCVVMLLASPFAACVYFIRGRGQGSQEGYQVAPQEDDYSKYVLPGQALRPVPRPSPSAPP